MAVRDFPRVVRLAFQPPVSFGVLLCFWKVETVSGRLGYFPIDQILAALQISVKMNLVQMLCLARHNGIHSRKQNYRQLRAIFIGNSKNSNDSCEFHKNSRNSEPTMEPRTSKSYQEEVLEKYKREKGGEMRGYLAEPTCSQIRDACIYLFHRRNEKNDEHILNRFFEFKNDTNKLREIQNFGIGKFKSIEKFLKGRTESTSTKNINLISWLIDFHPRPYEEYSKSNNPTSSEPPTDQVSKTTEEAKIIKETNKVGERTKPPKWGLVIKISIAFGAVLLTALALRDSLFNPNPLPPHENQCMAWADSLYVEVSCAAKPYSKYDTRVEPLDPFKLQNFKKVEVNMATQFFAEKTNKPLIWYYKNKDGEIEYYTAPGLHPITGKTLREITPYIIQTYVSTHINRADSFVQ